MNNKKKIQEVDVTPEPTKSKTGINKIFTIKFILILSGILLFFVLILLFNSGKKLVCTKTEDYESTVITYKVIFTFKRKTNGPSLKAIGSYDYSKDSTYSEEKIKKEIEEFNEKAKNEKDKYTAKAKLNGKIVTFTYKYTSDQYYNSAKEEINLMEDKSIEGYKKKYEENGYKCK